jgi:hypothetical protein
LASKEPLTTTYSFYLLKTWFVWFCTRKIKTGMVVGDRTLCPDGTVCHTLKANRQNT